MKTRGNRLLPDAFPAYKPFLQAAQPYAKLSGGRFLPPEFKEVMASNKPPKDERQAVVADLLKHSEQYLMRARVGDPDMHAQCVEAQRLVVREGVEKACWLAVMDLGIDPDPKIEGIDWDDLSQPSIVLATKIQNNMEARRNPEYKKKLLTAMFVTDFGLFCGYEKVSCREDELLLDSFLDRMKALGIELNLIEKPSSPQTQGDTGDTSSGSGWFSSAKKWLGGNKSEKEEEQKTEEIKVNNDLIGIGVGMSHGDIGSSGVDVAVQVDYYRQLNANKAPIRKKPAKRPISKAPAPAMAPYSVPPPSKAAPIIVESGKGVVSEDSE